MRPLLALLLAVACSKAAPKPPGARGEACSDATPCETGLLCTASVCAPPTRHYTFRAIGGVSMGAAGSSRFVADHAELFDAAGFLGGPLDAAFLARELETSLLGGFCPADKLEAALALDLADGGNRLDQPAGVPGCTQHDLPGVRPMSQPQRFNRWHYTLNGGHFDRGTHLDIFRDLTLSIGNPVSSNPNHPSLPAPLTKAQFDAATCAAPFRVPHVIDATYSPHGEHDAITFCDGDAPLKACGDGTVVDWCAAAALNGRKLATESDADAFCAAHGGAPHGLTEHSPGAEGDVFFAEAAAVQGCYAGGTKVTFALAIDLNGNGRRDYHEPLLVQAREPWSDVGKDGCANDREDGKGGCTASGQAGDPNGDDYDPVKNPNGTEGNWLRDPGEPFQDVGLDGVAGTHDEGEGDGAYTMSPGLKRWLDGDLRTRLQRDRPPLDLYAEGGIRDVFDLGAMAEVLSGAFVEPTRFGTFFDIPPVSGRWGSTFDPLSMDVAKLSRETLVNYGSKTASVADIRNGDGDHVGTPEQAYDRFSVFFRWLAKTWAPVLPLKARAGITTLHSDHFTSAALGAEQDFGVSLPPGYETSQQRYPVLFLLHGYGQTPQDFSGTSIFIGTLLNLGLMQDLIVVYPSGRCCLTGPNGERTCRDQNDAGQDYTSLGYVRECARGSFYLDNAGTGTKYGAGLVDLMHEVDARYRTLSPADGPLF